MDRQELDDLLAVLPLAAMVVDADRRVCVANDTARRLWDAAAVPDPGIDALLRSEVTATEPVRGPWAPGDAAADPPEVQLAADAGRGPRYRVQLSDLTVEGQPMRLLLLSPQSPTESPRTEALLSDALQAQRERLELVTETAEIGVFDRVILSDDAPPPYWTASMRRLLGYPMAAVADPDWFLHRVAKPDQTRMKEAIRRADAGDGRVEVQVRWHHPDGSDRYLLIRAGTLRRMDTDGYSPVRSIGVVMDVTAQKVLESQFQQAQKLEAVGRLAGGVAHDFNNLLSIILGCAELAAAQIPEQSSGHEDMRDIVLAAERAAGLTQQLLAFGRRQPQQPQVLDLQNVLQEHAPMLRRLLDASVDLTLNVAAGTQVFADQGQILQVLLNLVVNARDAMPDGGRLTIETTQQAVDDAADEQALRLHLPPGDYAVIAVSDTGHGMDEGTQQRMFEPFFTTKEGRRGTGLGLSTVFGIVHQSGGGIDVHSQVGHGTTFRIYLPAVAVDRIPPSQQQAR